MAFFISELNSIKALYDRGNLSYEDNNIHTIFKALVNKPPRLFNYLL